METAPPTVILIGPGPDQMGGMATVVAQIGALDLGGRYRIEFLPSTHGTDVRELMTSRVARHLRQLHRLRAVIRRTHARIVHIHTCSGFSFYRAVADMLLAQELGCRVILHVHGAAFDTFYAEEPAWRRRVITWSLTRADRVVALSAAWRAKLRGMAPRAHAVIVENAIDSQPIAEVPRPGPTCRFLLLARMDEWKGIEDLLQACADLYTAGVPFEFVLAGPPGTAGDAGILTERIRGLGIEDVVRYVGTVQGTDKSQWLAWADVYVQPSHHEGMPIAMLEALACGLPIVATRVGAVPEMIEHERQGLLVPPRRPDLLSQAMGELASDGRLRERMASAARERALTRFGLDRLRDDLIGLYDSVSPPRSESRELSAVSYPLSVDRREVIPSSQRRPRIPAPPSHSPC